ncbi:MAG TPA: hypothetical protein VEK76_01225 [Candidatus Binatia bacterium]|nr:hypothetical protein [Candidatus Binatia bacterium]
MTFRKFAPLIGGACLLALAGCSSTSAPAPTGTVQAGSTVSTPPAATAPPATATTASTATPAPAGVDLSGTWSGQYSGTLNGNFTLTWTQTGSNLSGHIQISNPAGTYGISGSLQGSSIQFGAVGVATYTGSVSGSSMSGNWQIATAANGSGGGSWSASKTS